MRSNFKTLNFLAQKFIFDADKIRCMNLEKNMANSSPSREMETILQY